jgi:hypothetical protein
LYILERNPQSKKVGFGADGGTAAKPPVLQVARYKGVTAQIFAAVFFLTWKPQGNKIQLQSFGGCDSVETDSPIEHHPGRTGKECSPLGVSISISMQILGLYLPHASQKG